MNGAAVKAYSRSRDGLKRLSTNFRVNEFACEDGSDVVFVSDGLVQVLQAIRSHFGRAVTVSSGYRTPSHNKKVGGAEYSQHLYGLAADITVKGIKPKTVAAYAETMLPGTGGIGVYDWGIHIDVRKTKSRWNG